jgi:NAD(P)-dependent dehydrogenase (short-subunit alcohol dehydrogenase family)
MGKTILVTGKESFLGNEINRFFLEGGHQVSVAVTPRKDVFPSLDQSKRQYLIPWNRRSAVAAKNFILQTEQELGPIDEAWVLVSPERESFALNDLPPLTIDETIDQNTKGLVYLIRELLSRQAQRPTLAIHFVFFEEDPTSLPPLGALQFFGLRGVVSSLLGMARRRSLPILAYDTVLQQPETYATWLLTPKMHSPGRWNIHGEKKSLLSLFSRKDAP